MARKKEQDRTPDYTQALKNKTIPLLSLDPKWHELFPDHEKTKEIKRLEKELNKLLKKQGKANNDLIELAKAKKLLMNTIVANMGDGHEADSEQRNKKKEKSSAMIHEINEKLVEAEQILEDIPAEIRIANQRLLVACMDVCYNRLLENTYKIEEDAEKVQVLREELKEILLEKQDLEMRNTSMYAFMHDMLGAEVLEIFDAMQGHPVWKGENE